MGLVNQRTVGTLVTALVIFLGVTLIMWGRYGLHGEERGPRLKIPACVMDLGSGKPGDTLTDNFIISNFGDAPLEFSAAAGCGCTDLTPQSGVIEPGRELSITVAVRLDSPGSHRDIGVRFKSNDKMQSDDAVVRVIATCPYPFEVTPGRVDFGQVARGRRSSLDITVSTIDFSTSAPSSPGEIVISNSDDNLLVEQLATQGKSSVFRITLLEESPVGSFHTTLKLRSPTSNSG